MNNNILVIGGIFIRVDSFGFSCTIGQVETRTVEADAVTDCFIINILN